MTESDCILPLLYFPSVSYYKILDTYPFVFLEMWETYPKQTYRNRCRILTANGVMDLSVPVVKTNGNHTTIRDIAIDNSTSWQRNHWRSIASAYRSSPFFLYYCDDIELIFKRQFNYLVDLNVFILEKTKSILGLDFQVNFTKQFEKPGSGKIILRDQFNPKKPELDTLMFTPYFQVFQHKFGFQSNLSIIDLIFCEGPGATEYIKSLKK